MENVLIGITGKKQNGKSTIAYYLQEYYGFTLVSFADSLKRACNDIFKFSDLTEAAKETDQDCKVTTRNLRRALNELSVDIDQVSQLFTEVFQEFHVKATKSGDDYKISPRKAYQLFGTEIGRTIDPDFWVKRVNLKNPRTVVADLRFNNEAKHIKDHDGIIAIVSNSRIDSNSKDSHASEAGIDFEYIDKFINNDQDFDTLYIELDNWLSSLAINRVERDE